MKKQDLKAGMMVEFASGGCRFLVPNKDGLQLIDEHGLWTANLNTYNEDLIYDPCLGMELDIIKVYGLSNQHPLDIGLYARDLLWERTPKIKLTNEEIEILKALKVLGVKAIARDKDGQLNAFDARFMGCADGYWLKGHNNTIRVKSSLFNFISCEELESINELLKGVK